MNIFSMLLQLALEVKGFTTLITHHSLGLLVHLVEVLAEVGVFLVALGTLQLMALMYEAYVLPKITVPLPTYWTRSAALVMHIQDVPLQVCLQVAAVTTVSTLVVLDLTVLLVDVMFQVGELSEAVRTFSKFF